MSSILTGANLVIPNSAAEVQSSLLVAEDGVLLGWARESVPYILDVDEKEGIHFGRATESLEKALRKGDVSQIREAKERLAQLVGRLDERQWRQIALKFGRVRQEHKNNSFDREVLDARHTLGRDVRSEWEVEEEVEVPSGSLIDMERRFPELGDEADFSVWSSLRVDLQKALGTLPIPLQMVVSLLYGIPIPAGRFSEAETEQIRKLLGRSRGRISEIRKKALRILRHPSRPNLKGYAALSSMMPTWLLWQSSPFLDPIARRGPLDPKLAPIVAFLFLSRATSEQTAAVLECYDRLADFTLSDIETLWDILGPEASPGQIRFSLDPIKYLQENMDEGDLKRNLIEVTQNHPKGQKAVGSFLASFPVEEWASFLLVYLQSQLPLDRTIFEKIRKKCRDSASHSQDILQFYQDRRRRISSGEEFSWDLESPFDRYFVMDYIRRHFNENRRKVALNLLASLENALRKQGVQNFILNLKSFHQIPKDFLSITQRWRKTDRFFAKLILREVPFDWLMDTWIVHYDRALPPHLLKNVLDQVGSISTLEIIRKCRCNFPDVLGFCLNQEDPLKAAETIGQIVERYNENGLTKSYQDLSSEEKMAFYIVAMKKKYHGNAQTHLIRKVRPHFKRPLRIS